LNSYLTASATAAAIDKQSTVGIFGSAGFNLLNILLFDGSYRWPMTMNSNGSIQLSSDNTLAKVEDALALKLTIPKGALPDFIKLSGQVSYERTKLVATLANSGGTLSLFDSNTVLKGEILYGLAQGVDLAIGVSTLIQRDATTGAVTYDTSGNAKVSPSISLETRIGF
jgi:hypothetical protein